MKALFEDDDVAMHCRRGGGVNGRALLVLVLLLFLLLRLLLVLLQKAESCVATASFQQVSNQTTARDRAWDQTKEPGSLEKELCAAQ